MTLSDTSRIVDRTTLIDRVRDARQKGSTIVLANGCFDVLHAGHIRYLEGSESDRRLPGCRA